MLKLFKSSDGVCKLGSDRTPNFLAADDFKIKVAIVSQI